MTNLQQWIDTGHTSHRKLLLLAGDLAWRLQQLSTHLADYCPTQGLWVESACLADIPSVSAKQLPHKLGQEVDFVVFHAEQGLSPNAIAIASGLIRAGGLAVFSLPSLEVWQHFANPILKNWLSYPYSLNEAENGFNRHFIDCWQSFQPNRTSPLERVSLPTPDQQQMITALQHLAQGHRHRPLVITADRGRGKSYALGLACHALYQSALSQSKPYRIALCASRPAQVEQVFQAFWQTCFATDPVLREAKVTKTPGLVKLAQFEIRFIAPDALLSQASVFDLVLVDEAAQLPVPMLSQFSRDHARIAFVTTTHGYEGSGRGFGINFYKALDQDCPSWQKRSLHQPIRWGEHDPLEAFINHLLWVPSPHAIEAGSSTTPNIAGLRFVWTRPKALDRAQLQQVFQLLLNAHYQTQPNDLLLLLEAPNLFLQLAFDGQTLIGVAQVMSEGQLPPELYQTTERRLQGHLVPQLLFKQTQHPVWLQAASWRIQRIAVAEAYQRQGIGQQLIQHLSQQAKHQQIDLLTTSFGATDPLIAFWQNLHFMPLHFGLKRDKASASHSLVLAYPLNEASKTLCLTHQTQWQWQFAYQLQDPLQSLPLSIALGVLRQLPFPQSEFPTGLCQATATPYEAVSWAFWHWLLGTLPALEIDENNQAIVQKSLFRLPWTQLSQLTGLSRKQIEGQLKEFCSSEASALQGSERQKRH